MNKARFLFTLLFFFGFIAVSCNESPVENSLLQSVTPSITKSKTKSPTPSHTPSPTRKRYPTLPPPTPVTPSPTPRSIEYKIIPTLPTNEANEYFLSLYNSLEDCNFPCWGPIILGKTKMETVQEALGPIASPEYISNKTMMDNDGNWLLLSSASWRMNLDNKFIELVVYGKNGIANEISFSIDGHSETLSHFLTSYGKPDEIWMSYLLPHFAERNIFLGLYYEQENVFIWYDMEGEINNNVQQGCGLSFFEMAVWSDMHEKQAVDDLYSAFYPGEARGLREVANLSALTSWEIDTFYEEYRNKFDQEVCISIALGTSE